MLAEKMTHSKHILIVCVLFALQSAISAETATCQFGQQTININKVPFNEYTCELSVGNPDNFISVSDIDGDHYGKSDDDVKFLIFSPNMKLRTLSATFCEKFPNLEAIKIENVKINSIDSEALQGCPNLKLLYLNNNNIREIPEDFLSENAELLEIMITSNQLKTLPHDTFEMQENLKILNLKSNQISAMPEKIFVALKSLETLYLDQNQLKILNPQWFKELIKLIRLHISSNGIAELPQGVFAKLTSLEVLDLKSNSLTVIHSNSFPSRSKIKYIEFSFNQIDEIDPKFVQNSQILVILMENNICFHTKASNQNIINTVLGNCYKNYKSRFQGFEEPPTATTTTQKPTTSIQHIPPPNEVPKLYEGKLFPRGTYPWIAAIMKQNVNGGEYYCGGVLVSNKKIVTAAKCVLKYERSRYRQMNPRDIKVYLGSHDLTASTEPKRIVSDVSRIQIHPKFKPDSIRNDFDIAVIVLDTSVSHNRFIESINLFEEDSEYEEIRDGTVASYGYRENNKLVAKSAPRELETVIEVVSNCLLKNQAIIQASGTDTFCINEISSNKVCNEDIGSGLFVKHENKFYLRGILTIVISKHFDLCDDETFSIYTDVAKHTNWIRSIPD